MRKIINFTILILIVSSAFSIKIVDKEDAELSLRLSGISALYYDRSEYDSLEYDTIPENLEEVGFEIKTFWLSLDGTKGNVSYSLSTAFDESKLIANEISARYKFNENFAIKMGYFKPSFGRINGSKEYELLFYERNPLVELFSYPAQLGVSPQISLADSKILIDLGIFGNSGRVFTEKGSTFQYTLAMHYMPLGKMDISESAIVGYDKLKIDICPVISHRNNDLINHFEEDDRNIDYYTIGGIQTAIRNKNLSIDMMYFFNKYRNPYVEDVSDTEMPITYSYSIHAAYIFMGKLEPAIRYSHINKKSSYYSSHVNDYYHKTNILELGTQYYFDNLNSRIGINYIYSEIKAVNHRNEYKYANDSVKLYYALQF